MIQFSFPGGLSLQLIARNAASQVWNGTVFETWNPAHLASYWLPATEIQTALYQAGEVVGATAFAIHQVGDGAYLGAIVESGYSDDDRTRDTLIKQAADKILLVGDVNTPVFIQPSITLPAPHLVPVVFDARQMGLPTTAQLTVYLVDKNTPADLGGTSELVTKGTTFKKDTTFTALPGAFLLDTPYIDNQSPNSGVYFASCAEAGYNIDTAKFEVPAASEGAVVALSIADLITAYRQAHL